VTEQEWLRCDDLAQLVRYVAGLAASTDPRRAQPGDGWMYKRMQEERGRKHDRQLRLFACACARRLWPLLGELGRRGVEASERYADGLAGPVELLEAIQLSFQDSGSWYVPPGHRGRDARRARGAVQARLLAAQAARGGSSGDSAAWAVIRYAPVAAKRARLVAGVTAAATAKERQAQLALFHDVLRNPFRAVEVDPAWLAWHGGAIPALARAVYDERELPSGHLDAARLAVLADMLEEAGATDPYLLGHLRSPGPHVRGCAAVDALTGRS
jgi:hypothetical protein